MIKPLGKLLDSAKAGAIIGIDAHTVAEYCRLELLPAHKHGRDWAIWERDAREFAKHPRPKGNPDWV